MVVRTASKHWIAAEWPEHLLVACSRVSGRGHEVPAPVLCTIVMLTCRRLKWSPSTTTLACEKATSDISKIPPHKKGRWKEVREMELGVLGMPACKVSYIGAARLSLGATFAPICAPGPNLEYHADYGLPYTRPSLMPTRMT